MGSASVLTQPTCQDPTAVINATSNAGYHFDHWSDGNTDNPRTMTLTSDTVVVAYFEEGNTGIDDVDGDGVYVYVTDGRIVVVGAKGQEVLVYDMMGRPMANHALPAGVYMVRVGDLPARKVVVIK